MYIPFWVIFIVIVIWSSYREARKKVAANLEISERERAEEWSVLTVEEKREVIANRKAIDQAMQLAALEAKQRKDAARQVAYNERVGAIRDAFIVFAIVGMVIGLAITGFAAYQSHQASKPYVTPLASQQ